MLARRLPTILPPLTPAESLETTRIYSAMGRLGADEPLMKTRPFRSPHHTISDAGMVGGGSVPAPGEISMAHHGVPFLDKLPEFHRRSLEVLRQPPEADCVTLSRPQLDFSGPLCARCGHESLFVWPPRRQTDWPGHQGCSFSSAVSRCCS